MTVRRGCVWLGGLALLLVSCGASDGSVDGLEAKGAPPSADRAEVTGTSVAAVTDLPGEIPDRVRVADGTSIAGYLSQTALDERDRRNLEWATGPDGFSAETMNGTTLEANERRQELFAARSVVDPVEVTDEDGRLVGYMADAFVPLERYEEELAEAEALLAEEADRRALE